jgi:hypothetical protein
LVIARIRSYPNVVEETGTVWMVRKMESVSSANLILVISSRHVASVSTPGANEYIKPSLSCIVLVAYYDSRLQRLSTSILLAEKCIIENYFYMV